MGRNKLFRFKQSELSRNVVQAGKDNFGKIKGKWNEEQFQNNNPLTVELACGRGEFTVGLARVYPDRNFIGVDIKGSRIWKGSTTAAAEDLANVAFLRCQIESLDDFFEKEEITELWITFPDPQIKYKRTKHRLTNAMFLDRYKNILKPEGIINLKTDSEFMHGYTLGLLHGLGEIVEFASMQTTMYIETMVLRR